MLLGFKKQFATPILSGSKKYTIRNPRKIQPKIGERVFMYSGLRTRNTQKISDSHELKSTQKVDIEISCKKGRKSIAVTVDSRRLADHELEAFAQGDGFSSVADLTDYWLSDIPKDQRAGSDWETGVLGLDLYHWTDLKI
jgi:hypothetical protein